MSTRRSFFSSPPPRWRGADSIIRQPCTNSGHDRRTRIGGARVPAERRFGPPWRTSGAGPPRGSSTAGGRDSRRIDFECREPQTRGRVDVVVQRHRRHAQRAGHGANRHGVQPLPARDPRGGADDAGTGGLVHSRHGRPLFCYRMPSEYTAYIQITILDPGRPRPRPCTGCGRLPVPAHTRLPSGHGSTRRQGRADHRRGFGHRQGHGGAVRGARAPASARSTSTTRRGGPSRTVSTVSTSTPTPARRARSRPRSPRASASSAASTSCT